MRAYHFTLPTRLDSVLEHGLGFEVWTDRRRLNLDKDPDLIDAFKTVLETKQLAIVEIEIPDRTWMTVNKEEAVLYETIKPTWIVGHSIV